MVERGGTRRRRSLCRSRLAGRMDELHAGKKGYDKTGMRPASGSSPTGCPIGSKISDFGRYGFGRGLLVKRWGHVRGCLLRPLQEIACGGGPGDFCITPRSCDDSRDRASVTGVESTLAPGHHASSLAQRSIAKYSPGRIVVYARAGGANAGPSVVFEKSRFSTCDGRRNAPLKIGDDILTGRGNPSCQCPP